MTAPCVGVVKPAEECFEIVRRAGDFIPDAGVGKVGEDAGGLFGKERVISTHFTHTRVPNCEKEEAMTSHSPFKYCIFPLPLT